MSLRDQLLKAGLASKKDARRTKQQQRKERKLAQGHEERKSVRERREAEAKAAAEEREREARAARRRAASEVRDRYERALRIRQIIRAHEVRGGGPVRFFFRDPSGRQVRDLAVSAGVARSLERGHAVIAAEDMGNRIRYAVVSEGGAEKLRELAPEVLVSLGESGPEPARVERDWLPDLRARRATAADLERFRAKRPTSGDG